MRTIAALAAALACGAFATTSHGASEKAGLRLVDRDPLTVTGSGFVPGGRLVISAFVEDAAPGPTRKTVYATGEGRFRAIFSRISANKCDSVRVVAKGPGGEATLKLMPQVMCMPSLAR